MSPPRERIVAGAEKVWCRRACATLFPRVTRRRVDTAFFLLGLTPLALLSSPARAQERVRAEPESFVQQQRALDERLRRQFDEELGPAAKTAFDWGGWYSVNLFIFDDGVESSRTLRRHDLRLWGRLSLEEGAHEFYLRGRLSFLDFNTGDAYDGNDDDTEGPNLERGTYTFNLARALHQEGTEGAGPNLLITAGRDLVQFGDGLALATPLDHVAVRGSLADWEWTGLAGKTVGSSQDFDLSRTATRTRRNFLGTQAKYRGFERHEPFAYALWQRDHNREAFPEPYQGYGYDSFYFGLGSIGELASRLRYATEWVYETGHGYSQSSYLVRNDVEAWACRAELEYLFSGATKPRASIEYLFGSGDGDRSVSPTNTFGGNNFDGGDSSFIGFGYRDTGLSFAPRYSNLHMGRAGASFYPWPEDRRLRGVEIGTDWFLYAKHHDGGAVSDPTADKASNYLGWEMDYFANWRITADLAWTARLGAFFPGDAFSDRTSRTFFLIGMTWSF